MQDIQPPPARYPQSLGWRAIACVAIGVMLACFDMPGSWAPFWGNCLAQEAEFPEDWDEPQSAIETPAESPAPSGPEIVEYEGEKIDPAEATAAGKQAFAGTSNFPWYDRARDETRAIRIPPPRTNWSSQSQQPINPGTPPTTSALDIIQLFFWLVVVLLLAGILWIVIRMFWRGDNDGFTRVRAPGGVIRAARLEELPVELNPAVRDLLSEAARLTEAGDTRLAIIYLYSHLLVTLDQYQLIYLSKGKTNRQYYREIRQSPAAQARPELSDYFHRVMLAFEESFFGGHELPPSLLREFLAAWPNVPLWLRPGAEGQA
ncbi:MAG: DUF4129 domain-containing protein [Pirellulales bacterium]|nr:DUF4129 domain-containing protein [Pirellulales bacterium]